MTTCPDGHESSTDDWCDVCGAPIGTMAAPVDAGTELVASARPSVVLASCRVCGSPRPSADRFCEHCGSDLAAADPDLASWVAEVAADQALYDRVGPVDATFPAGRPPTIVPISAPEMLIGRSHEARGIRAAIDLSGPLGDPGVSHRHAVLTRLEDGSYAITDLGSTNGTTLNDGRVIAEPERRYPLADGDRIHVGAWTTITVRRRTG